MLAHHIFLNVANKVQLIYGSNYTGRIIVNVNKYSVYVHTSASAFSSFVKSKRNEEKKTLHAVHLPTYVYPSHATRKSIQKVNHKSINIPSQ